MKQSSIIALLVFAGLLAAVIAQDIISTENTMVKDVDDLYWLDKDVALILTDGGKVFRSTNSGFSWTDITGNLDSSSSSIPSFLYPSPTDSSKVYIRGSRAVSWISRDKGSNWKAVNPTRLYRNLDWHPTQSEWALAWVSSNDVVGDLYITKDFTQSWELVSKDVYQYYWGDAGTGSVPQNRIYMIKKGSSFRDLVQSDNFGESVETLQSNTYAAIWMTKHLFTAVALFTSQKSVLKVTPHVGKVFKQFAEAEFPFGDELDYNGYTLLDDATGAVYLGVNHGDRSRSKWGNLYISDEQGYDFATSLQHVAMNAAQAVYDFDRIFGVEGVYLANVLLNYNDNNAPFDRIATLLTMDNGNSWNSISRPVKDINGDPYVCNGVCNLQLHGWNSLDDYFGPFYSTDKAVGLVISTGNVGEYLSFTSGDISTYLSRDAGLTWKEYIRGSTIYEIGDHGNIIVFAPYGQSTNVIYYTLDQGQTPFKTHQITKNNITVYNIQHEPSNTNTRFVLTGHRNGQDVVVGLDFSQVYGKDAKVCQVEADYDTFMLSNGRAQVDGMTCLLGREVTYRRRKATSKCFSPDNLVTEKSRRNCPCTPDDFECDVGFERRNGACMLEEGAKTPTYPPAFCPPGFQYWKTNGYRKEAGNTCQGGQSGNFSPDGPYNCTADADPTNPTKHKSKGWIAALVILLVVGAALGGAAFALRNDKIRDRLPELPWLQNWKNGYFKFGGNNGLGAPDTLLDEDDDLFLPRDRADDDEESGHNDIPHGQEFSDFSGISTSSNANEAMHASLDDDPFDPRK